VLGQELCDLCVDGVTVGLVRLLAALGDQRLDVAEALAELRRAAGTEVVVVEVRGVREVGAPAQQVEGQLARSWRCR
jgi:hypothetical protein